MRRVLCPLLLITIALPFAFLWSQQCPQAPVLSPSNQLNLFTEEQEMMLGEAFAEHLAYRIHVIEDPEIAGYLQRVGQRLVEQLPASRLKFRFYVIDSPEANAFAVAGGRIYVTRKLISLVKDEDELAGVLAHELGHQLAHHSALQWSRVFRNVLKMEKLEDHADIEGLYNDVLDSYGRNRGAMQSALKPGNEQVGADQVSVYALARAGYSPQAMITFWDRFAETKGNTGGWLSDFFGTGLPESKRLREMVKDVEKIPTQCREPKQPRSDGGEFQRWQATVKTYSGFGKKEDLHNVLLQRTLTPFLRGDIDEFRFSRDGKYLLAQDASNIFVLQRSPLQVLFRIPAAGARKAQFSPDSQYVVFHTRGFRVERWSIAQQHLEEVNELHIFGGCAQQALSPDGRFLACVRPDRQNFFPLDFLLYDVAAGAPVITKERFAEPGGFSLAILILIAIRSGNEDLLEIGFSPDGKYLIAGTPEAHLFVDLAVRAEQPMSGALKKFTSYNFAFVGPDRIIATDDSNGVTASIVSVPSGQVLDRDIRIGGTKLYAASKGEYALVRPLPKAPLGILDLKLKKVFVGSKTDAMDIFDGQFVTECVNGEICLYAAAGTEPLARVSLPRATLSEAAAVSASADLSTLAVSERTRGTVWDLKTGRVLVSTDAFAGVAFAPGVLYLDFLPLEYRPPSLAAQVSKQEMDKPGHAIGRLDLSSRSVAAVYDAKRRTSVRQIGMVVLASTPKDDAHPAKNVLLEARDAKTGSVLWSRQCAEGPPAVYGSADTEHLVLAWEIQSAAGKEEWKNDARARSLVSSLADAKGAYWIEIVDPQSGKIVAQFPVSTGRASFQPESFRATAGTMLMRDDNRRILLFSYTGEKRGRLFGGYAVLSRDGRKLAVEREPGRVVVYDTATLQERDQFTFGSDVVSAQFDEGSDHLLVLTADETAFVLGLTKSSASGGGGEMQEDEREPFAFYCPACDLTPR